MKGQIPNTPLRRVQLKRLFVFPDDKHPYDTNIFKNHEEPYLHELSRREWHQMSAEDLLAHHDQWQRQQLEKLLK